MLVIRTAYNSKRTTAVLSLPEVWPRGQDLQVRCPDLQVLRRKTRIHPMQRHQNSHTKVCQLRTGACHHQSALPKKLEAMNKVKTSCAPATKRPTIKQGNRKPSPIPLTNAWATLTVQEVEKRPF